MTVYCDVSYLFALRVPVDRWHSAVAGHWPAIQPEQKLFTWLHRLELYNLIRHATLRQPAPYSANQARALLTVFKRDVYQGMLQYTDFALPEVLQEVTGWSAAHGFQQIVTTFDLLHICASVVLGADRFITTDDRQHQAALLAGLSSVLVR